MAKKEIIIAYGVVEVEYVRQEEVSYLSRMDSCLAESESNPSSTIEEEDVFVYYYGCTWSSSTVLGS